MTGSEDRPGTGMENHIGFQESAVAFLGPPSGQPHHYRSSPGHKAQSLCSEFLGLPETTRKLEWGSSKDSEDTSLTAAAAAFSLVMTRKEFFLPVSGVLEGYLLYKHLASHTMRKLRPSKASLQVRSYSN